VDQVEGNVVRRPLAHGLARAFTAEGQALLQPIECQPAGLPHHQLAVQAGVRRQLRDLIGRAAVGAGGDRDQHRLPPLVVDVALAALRAPGQGVGVRLFLPLDVLGQQPTYGRIARGAVSGHDRGRRIEDARREPDVGLCGLRMDSHSVTISRARPGATHPALSGLRADWAQEERTLAGFPSSGCTRLPGRLCGAAVVSLVLTVPVSWPPGSGGSP
jgi:hypothetical protein